MTAVYVPPVTERKRIPQRAIEAVVSQIAKKFHPEKIIMFGSYARGNPRPESDLDLLIILDEMPNERRKSLEIRHFLGVGFGLDLVVHSPENLRQRLEWGDSFLQEIVQTGKVMYESPDA
jgi:predicted nucleotidyltransferase